MKHVELYIYAYMYTIATTFSETFLYPVKLKGTEPDQRSVEKKKPFIEVLIQSLTFCLLYLMLQKSDPKSTGYSNRDQLLYQHHCHLDILFQ